MHKNVDNVYLIMDSHTVLHNSENLLSSLYKIYGEDKINLNVTLKSCKIPSDLDEIFINKENNIIEKIA